MGKWSHRGRHRLAGAALAAFTAGVHAAPPADLTDAERLWLGAGWPVIEWARAQGLPLDVVVQPVARATDVPLAMGFSGGRCKLVLTVRDLPEAAATVDDLPAALLGPALEAMVAHEVGHCWRTQQGMWHTLPAGFVADDADDARGSRSEEAYADLVGLAWTWARHPRRYAEVQSWLESLRDDRLAPGGPHDTVHWVRAARDPAVFDRTAATPFLQAWPAWRAGLVTAQSAGRNPSIDR